MGLLTLAAAADDEMAPRDERHMGLFDFVTEERVMQMVGIDFGDPECFFLKEFYKHLSEIGMIEISKDGKKIKLLKYKKRQNTNLTEAERSHDYRQRNKKEKVRDERHIYESDERHARLEEIREEEIHIATDVAPFSSKEYVDMLRSDKKEHVKLIGHYFFKRRMSFGSKQEAEIAMKRHMRAATQVVKFSKEKINDAIRKCEAMTDIEWTVDTILKVLTK